MIKQLFHCYGLELGSDMDSELEKYSLYEHLPPVQRKIEPDESPVYVQSQWSCPDKSRLVLRLCDDPESDSEFESENNQVQACSSPLKSSPSSVSNSVSNNSVNNSVSNNSAGNNSVSDNSVFARPARVIEVIDDSPNDSVDNQDDSMMMGLDTSYCSSGESTASSEFSALRFRDSPMSASSR